MSDAIQLAGLWKSEKPTRNGDAYYKGKAKETVTIEAGSMVCLFKNSSDNPKAPTFTITVLPPMDAPRPAERHYGDNGSTAPADDDVPW